MVRQHVARRVWVLIGAVAAAAALAAAALLVGEFPVPWRGVARALGEPGTAPESVDFIIWEVRVPRLLAGAASGAALSVAAAVLQTATGSPLAGPRTVGMGGAAMLAILLAPAAVAQVPAGAAAAGAAGAAAAGLGLVLGAWWWGSAAALRSGRVLPAGAVVDAVCTAAALYLVVSAAGGLVGPAAHRVVVGSPLLGVEQAPVLAAVCLGAALPAVAAAWWAPSATAAAPVAGRLALVAVAAVPVGAGVALAGPLALAGLAGGGVAWLLMSGHPGWTALAAVPVGAFVVVAADLVARSLSGPQEVPTGYVTAVAGVLVLAVVLRARSRAAAVTTVRMD
ncbi:iron complex transport system permease protein [Nocardiopsis mwathae]|uniref:Iron complex transport system permease protein n=1 Tax=Nocardiopsis mwathae TaxID=1472723 RepID=A0A7W9YGP6_9ACTN|nr:iron chelate uptake ABC transporter family permease subunit [Nocardiopsis mwathae]MBB6171819.1 iron complex transport system permease protein [Nocardiopsis mwathae]